MPEDTVVVKERARLKVRQENTASQLNIKLTGAVQDLKRIREAAEELGMNKLSANLLIISTELQEAVELGV